MTPYVPRGTEEAIIAVLRSQFVGQGPRVDEFEREFSRRIVNGRPSIAVSSCTAALHLSYVLSRIDPHDEVIAPVFTCTAGNEVLLDGKRSDHRFYHGATIRFCDVAPNSLNMDPVHLERLISEKTKAVWIVHYGGAPASPELFTIARRFNVRIVEDCAQAIGTGWPGMRGDFACFSFQAVKHITTFDGGMLVLNPDLVDSYMEGEARRCRWFGIDRAAKLRGTWENDIREVGWKYQMTDVSAAAGLVGLDYLPSQIIARRQMREAYMRGLDGIDGIRLLDTDPESACWLCTVLVEDRANLRRKLEAENIKSEESHYRNDRYSIFHKFRGEFPNMDAIDSKYLCLPMHMNLDQDDIGRICDVIRGGW